MKKEIKYISEKEKELLIHLKERLLIILGEDIKKIILFGSKARGDFDEDSDIDVAIIVTNLDKVKKKIILDEITKLELEYYTPLSTLILSEDEFELLKKRKRRIALDIEREGIEI